MSVGIPLAHLENGFFLNWKQLTDKGHGIEYNVAILGLTLSIMLAGSGPLSLDRLLAGALR